MYQYHGFGLNIASELEMPELYPFTFENADVTIRLGKVPESLNGTVTKRGFSIINENEYILNIKNVCSYYAGYGHTIIAQPHDDIDARSIRLFLLGTVMASVLYQRGYIPLHASGIIKHEKLILFTGRSGAGKSTLLAQLSARGYEVFTDDICVLQQDNENNVIYGIASYPMMKLWDDAINKLDKENFNKDFKVRPSLPKYGLFFHDKFDAGKYPIDKIFILNADNTIQKQSYTPLNALQAFAKLEKQAYRYRFATGENRRKLHFSLMSTLTNTAQVMELNRPRYGADINSFLDMVQKLL